MSQKNEVEFFVTIDGHYCIVLMSSRPGIDDSWTQQSHDYLTTLNKVLKKTNCFANNDQSHLATSLPTILLVFAARDFIR